MFQRFPEIINNVVSLYALYMNKSRAMLSAMIEPWGCQSVTRKTTTGIQLTNVHKKLLGVNKVFMTVITSYKPRT